MYREGVVPREGRCAAQDVGEEGGGRSCGSTAGATIHRPRRVGGITMAAPGAPAPRSGDPTVVRRAHRREKRRRRSPSVGGIRPPRVTAGANHSRGRAYAPRLTNPLPRITLHAHVAMDGRLPDAIPTTTWRLAAGPCWATTPAADGRRAALPLAIHSPRTPRGDSGHPPVYIQ